ncbi:cingulin isoform X2 [Gouania willdenowi]|uniref:cingulin isoform X2 n=1 Tax=Gouania willdenowi TaxID=441366 RepID=UPI001055AD70|nr:cingulin-like isoform X2 [Gouania willdenowi]
MSSLSAERKPLVDYGVQIRFIKDLHDTGGGYPEKSRGNSIASPTNKYGVAVRVQGISGHPYVVLKDGEKGDSYGVQLNTPNPTSGTTSNLKSLPNPSQESEEFTNPYGVAANTAQSPVLQAEEEDEEVFGSPLKRPPGDGQGDEEGGAGGEGQSERPKKDLHLKATVVGETEEYNEAGLKPVRLTSAGPKGAKQTGSLGSYRGKNLSADSSQAIPKRPVPDKEPLPVIDTNSLAPINKLISKFNSAAPGVVQQTRGRSGARQRLRFDERRRSRSLDARKSAEPEDFLPPPVSPTLNPYGAPLSSSSHSMSSSTSSTGIVGKSPVSVAKVTLLEAPKRNLRSPENARDVPPAIAKKPPILPRSQSHNMEVYNGVETQSMQAIHDILKNGTNDGVGSMQRKVNLLFENTSSSKRRGSEETLSRGDLEDLHDRIKCLKQELQQAHDELAEERMARDKADSRVRLQEDQLAELQEELRRVSENGPQSDSLQTDMMTLQTQLVEAAMLRQRQDETLHQRERELTALKGALKEEVECHDKEMEALREQYSQDMEDLRRTMEQFTLSQEQIEEERERVNASMSTLEEELEICKDQGEQWKNELEVTTMELHRTQEELKDLLAMKEQTPDANPSLTEELQRCHDDLMQTRAVLDKQTGELDKKSEALEALRRACSEKEAELQREISRLKEQSQKDKAELEKAKESSAEGVGKTVLDHSTNQELQDANNRLRERLARMTRLHSSVPRGSDLEEAMEALEDENRSLKIQLDDAKRGSSRLSKERDDLTRRLEERDLERDALRRGKSDLEEQKRLLDRALEKINKEMEMMMGDSRQSVATLQSQLDDYRERSRKELLDSQRSSKDRLAELQRAQSNLKAQQEEVSRLKKELLSCNEERDSAQLERDLFNNRLKHLEIELESEKNTQSDRTRELRGLEDKIKSMEIELDEERSSVELMNDRITRSRDQVDQLRSELMQERSARHDLEMDKTTLERQVKELKSRLADVEDQPRPSAGITLLENKIQELEERLHSEEREKASVQASQRRTERKLKELTATLDQERTQHVEQRDQLALRVKALKRQLDESEGEVERLEGVRRKVLRELEEQQELQEALQAKVTALETELKRKSQHTHRTTVGSTTLSSEEEDSLFDTNISSILNEHHLQTSNC